MKKAILIFILMFGIAIYLHAGILSGPNQFGTGVYYSSIVLGDIDKDGDLIAKVVLFEHLESSNPNYMITCFGW